ncbi:MAG: hypothetical protein V4463_12010 [Pseudomonadota bacterium]
MTNLIHRSGEQVADAAWLQLLDWQENKLELAFVYTRSQGGLIQTGRCRIAQLTAQSTSLEATGGKLLIRLAGARFEIGPQVFFTPDLNNHFNVDGVAVHLGNHDWLFFSASPVPINVALNAPAM